MKYIIFARFFSNIEILVEKLKKSDNVVDYHNINMAGHVDVDLDHNTFDPNATLLISPEYFCPLCTRPVESMSVKLKFIENLVKNGQECYLLSEDTSCGWTEEVSNKIKELEMEWFREPK